MASTNYTANLGLCDWAATDKPKRADFVSDNNTLDTVVGGHIADTNIHVTAAEKALYSKPYSVFTYAGDGEATRTISVSDSPKLAIVFQKYEPFVTVDADNNNVVHCAIVYYGLGASSGVSLSTTALTVSQDTTATDGIINNLNEEYGQYVVVLFR